MFFRKFVLVFYVTVFMIIGSCCHSSPPVKEELLAVYVPPQKIERAIVLPGGALRGAFQVGALYYLIEELGLDFQMVTGVSIGAFNGVMVAQKKVGVLKDFWLSLESRDDVFEENIFGGVLASLLFSITGVNDTTKLQGVLDKFVDMNMLRTMGIDFWVGVVDFQTNQYVEVNQADPDFKKFVLASAMIPAYFPLVEIRGHQYADGGIRRMISFEPALRAGVKELVVILPFNRKDTFIPYQKKHLRETYTNFVNVVEHTIEIMMNATYQSDIREMESRAKELGVNIVYVEPQPGYCDYGCMDFDKKEIAACVEHGYNQAKKLFPRK